MSPRKTAAVVVSPVPSADDVARASAQEALSQIEKHEAVCAERQGHIIQSLNDVKRGVEGLYRRFWAAAIGIITLLIGACGALLYMILTHGGG